MISLWLVNAYIEVTSKHLTFSKPSDVPSVEAVIVPGASVYRSGKLSPVLEARMRAALPLLASQPHSKLMVSGHAIRGGYSETQAMADWAKKQGVEPTRILVDNGGRSTYVTLLHCRREFKLTKIALVTQPFHLPRALYVGNRLGMQVYGYPASDSNEDADFPLREVFVRFKDFILVKISRGFNAH